MSDGQEFDEEGQPIVYVLICETCGVSAKDDDSVQERVCECVLCERCMPCEACP